MLSAIQQLLSLAFDGLLWPLSDSPRLALVWCAVMLGVLAGWLMRWLTPRKLLARLSERSKAEFLAIRFFSDQPLGLMSSFLLLLRLTLSRLACFLPAIVVLLPISLLVEAELEQRFELRPPHENEAMIVELKFTAAGWNERQDVRLAVPGMRSRNVAQRDIHETQVVVTGPLLDVEEQKVYWSLQPTWQEGTLPESTEFVIEFKGGALSLPLVLSNDFNLVTPLRHEWGPDDLQRYWHGASTRSDASYGESTRTTTNRSYDKSYATRFDSANVPIAQLTVNYPTREWKYFSYSVPWQIVFGVCFVAVAWFTDRSRRATF